MNVIAIEIAIVSGLLLLNAVFSMSEMAIVSAKKLRLQQLELRGNKGAVEALKLAESPSRFLSTVQIGITLVGVLSGAFGGATISEQIGFVFSDRFAIKSDIAEGIGVAVVVTVITYFSVVIGELVPKQLALKYPERIAVTFSRPMNLLSKISSPVVWIFSASTEAVLRLLHIEGGKPDPGVTHDEIRAMVKQGAEDGVLENQEKLMLERVLSFGRRRVTTLMTLARDVVWLDKRKSLDAQLSRILESGFSVIPVTEGGLDHLVGTVRCLDLQKSLGEPGSTLERGFSQPIFIPETATALQALAVFQKSGHTLGFVIDEFGAILGLLTVSDLTRAIVGDSTPGDFDPKCPIVRRTDGSWLADGALPVDALKELLKTETLDGEESHLFQTLGGFVMYHLGRVPKETDVLYRNGWWFEVLDMDRNRIDKVSIARDSSLVQAISREKGQERLSVHRKGDHSSG